MAYHNFRGKRSKILVSKPSIPSIAKCFVLIFAVTKTIHIESGSSKQDPLATPDSLIPQIDADTALVVVQYPDFFGRVFDLTALATKVHEARSAAGCMTNPTALGLLKTPGEYGADIVVGEGQPLEFPLSFGGPYLGFFATTQRICPQDLRPSGR